MGRQIPIFATKADADTLIAFMREIAEIAIFVDFASTAEGLWVEAPDVDANPFFHVWNERFPWTPEYGRVGEKAYNSQHIGWYYVANTGAAPVRRIRLRYIEQGKVGTNVLVEVLHRPRGTGVRRRRILRMV